MPEKTIVLRKGSHWYVVSSRAGDESEILLSLLEMADERACNVERDDVKALIESLGWTLEMHDSAA